MKKLIDNDYAACICYHVFDIESTDDDMHVYDILDQIKILDEKEQQAFEYFYGNGMALKEKSEKLGDISGDQACHIVNRDVRKLRYSVRSDTMSIIRMKTLLNIKDSIISTLSEQLENLMQQIETILQGKSISQVLQDIQEKQKVKIDDIDFSTRAYNILTRAGFHNIESLLALDDVFALVRLRNCGKRTILEIITKMREYGYSDWAKRMEMQYRKDFS